MVIHSCTKYINGHADVLMGAVMTNSEEISQHLYLIQKSMHHIKNLDINFLDAGSVPSQFDCFLVIRGTKTLHVSMRTHMENALCVAKFLETHPKVEKVY